MWAVIDRPYSVHIHRVRQTSPMRHVQTLLESVHRDSAVGFERQQRRCNAVNGPSRLHALEDAINVHGSQP